MSKDFLDLEINGKSYKIPTSFDSLTLEQYCKAFYKLPKVEEDMSELEKFKIVKENESRILSRIMGEKDDFCMNLPLGIYARLNEAIQFIYDSNYFIKNAKAGIVIDKKRYSIPPMNEMSMRQYIELLSVLLLTQDNNGKWIPYNGDYQELMGKVRQLKCSDALGLVYHFFKRGEALKKISKASMKMEEVNQQLQHIQNS